MHLFCLLSECVKACIENRFKWENREINRLGNFPLPPLLGPASSRGPAALAAQLAPLPPSFPLGRLAWRPSHPLPSRSPAGGPAALPSPPPHAWSAWQLRCRRLFPVGPARHPLPFPKFSLSLPAPARPRLPCPGSPNRRPARPLPTR
jgi:hypothetical protein